MQSSPSVLPDIDPRDAELFRRCRRALNMSVAQLQEALSIANAHTIRRWEDSTRQITGPTWVALCYMLRDIRQEALVREISPEWHRENWR